MCIRDRFKANLTAPVLPDIALLGVEVQYVSDRYNDVGRGYRNFWLVNATLFSHRWKDRWEASLSAYNLFEASSDRTGIRDPGTAEGRGHRREPSWTALVSVPISAGRITQLRIKSSAALLAENHNEVPKSCARTMTGTGLFMKDAGFGRPQCHEGRMDDKCRTHPGSTPGRSRFDNSMRQWPRGAAIGRLVNAYGSGAAGAFKQSWVSALSLIHISEPTRPY